MVADSDVNFSITGSEIIRDVHTFGCQCLEFQCLERDMDESMNETRRARGLAARLKTADHLKLSAWSELLILSCRVTATNPLGTFSPTISSLFKTRRSDHTSQERSVRRVQTWQRLLFGSRYWIHKSGFDGSSAYKRAHEAQS